MVQPNKRLKNPTPMGDDPQGSRLGWPFYQGFLPVPEGSPHCRGEFLREKEGGKVVPTEIDNFCADIISILVGNDFYGMLGLYVEKDIHSKN